MVSPDQWATSNRIYPASAAIPGPRDPGLTPYVIEIERAVAECRAKRVVVLTAAQSGKTDMLLDIAGARLDQRPVPTIYVGPSKQFLVEQFEPRVMMLLDDAPSLTGKLVRGKRMTKTRKTIAGVAFRLAHAGSSAALKSDPAGLALIDEYDEMLLNVKGQGDPLALVERRGDTYPDFVAVVTSTCRIGTIDIQRDEKSGLDFWAPAEKEDIFESPVWQLWQQGTRYHWTWPCPHCHEYFVPRFALARWPEGKSPTVAAREVYLECPRCGGVIEDKHKAAMNAHGRYVAPGQTVDKRGKLEGDPPSASAISYWVSGFASPFVTFGDRIRTYLEAVEIGDDGKIQVAVNAGFGELYRPGRRTAPKWQEVAEHKAAYAKGDLPDGVLKLVVTVDVQGNRLIYCTRGWGARATSWLLDWGEFFGDTVFAEPWEALSDYISNNVCGLPVNLVVIDSGFRPGGKDDIPLNRVYDFCRRFPRLVRASKGASTPMPTPLKVNKLEVTVRGKAARYGLEYLRLDTDHWKSWVHERLAWPTDQLGAWYLPHDVDDDYMRQIVAESRSVRPNGKAIWIEHSRINHFLDCEAMQAAAAHLLNMARVPPSTPRAPPRVLRVNQPPDKGGSKAAHIVSQLP